MNQVWNVFLEGVLPMSVLVQAVAAVSVMVRVRAGRRFRDVVFVSAVEALLLG